MFKRQTDEIKQDIREQVDELVENGRVLSIGILAISCLTVWYIIGSVTTGAMCKAIVRIG